MVSRPMLAGATGTVYVKVTTPLAFVVHATGLHVPVAPAFWPVTVKLTRYPPTSPAGPCNVAVTVCELSDPSSLTAEDGVSTRSYTSMFTHVCTLAVPPVTSLPNAFAQASWDPGERPGVLVDQVTLTGPAAGVAGDVVSTLGAPP